MATTETASPAGTLINYRTEGGLAWIEMNDLPANTYTHEMMLQLDAAILRARFDTDVHVIILRGTGDKFFCAGANIKMLASVTPEFKYYFCLHANETLTRLKQTPKLVLAALNGHTVGGGLEIALAADIRLARLVGKSRAIELMVTGRTFSFEEAEEIGLVNQVLDRDAFDEQVTAYAKQFVPPRKAARAVCSGLEMAFGEGLALERELQQHLFQSEDAHEGLAAYVEKRAPNFKAK